MADRANTTLQSAKQRSGLSYQMMADRLDVSKGVLYNYLQKGIEPKDKEIRRKLGLDVEGEWVIQFVQRDELGRFT